MNTMIITDSVSELRSFPKQIEKLKLDFIEIEYDFADIEEKIKGNEFWSKLREGSIMRSASANLQKVEEKFRFYLDRKEDIIYIGMSKNLSGNFDNISRLCEKLREEYPSRKIEAIDSNTISVPLGLIAYKAALDVYYVKSFEGTVKDIHKWIKNSDVYFAINDLKFLQRSGRISHVKNLFASMLSIRPIMTFEKDGKIALVGKGLGIGGMIKNLAQRIERENRNLEPGTPIIIVHGDNKAIAEKLAAEVKKLTTAEILIARVSEVVGGHTGPDALGIGFLKVDKDNFDNN